MGRTVCEAVDGADDLRLTGRADPATGTALADVLGDADVVVDFTVPDQALHNARAALEAGVHVVIGTTGFDVDDAARSIAAGKPANVFAAPELRDRRGADDALRRRGGAAHAAPRRSSSCTTRRKLDAPSGTAQRTAELMGGDVPIHSVRLPGVVADQEVILGDVAQTLTHPPRHDRPHELHARRAARGAPRRRARGLAGRSASSTCSTDVEFGSPTRSAALCPGA